MDDDRVSRVLAEWDALADSEVARYFPVAAVRHEMAVLAVQALQCGARHPDRPSVVCTEFPHENGPLTHRNAGLRLEWWRGGGNQVFTVHDDLGKIELFPDAVSPAGRRQDTDSDQEHLNGDKQTQGTPEVPASVFQDALHAFARAQKALRLVTSAYNSKRGLTAPLYRAARDADRAVSSVLRSLQEVSGILASTQETS